MISLCKEIVNCDRISQPEKLVSISKSAQKMSEQSATSSPTLPNSTSPSSTDIQTPHLNAVSEEDKLEAARLKLDANKAFTCEVPHQILWIQD
jgi:hypothetical protein